MASILDLQTFTDARGNLTVIDNILPFAMQRIFYIYGVDSSIRGKHRHKTTVQAAICLVGKCRISWQSAAGEEVQEILLDHPSKCLIIDPHDWHFMDQFSPDAILMVLASAQYAADDYIYEPYV